MMFFLLPSAEPVAVGLMLKNPMGIPLLMTHIALMWQFMPSSSSTSSLLSPTSKTTPIPHGGSPTSEERPAAVCEVLEQIQLQPNEQRMVGHHACALAEVYEFCPPL